MTTPHAEHRDALGALERLLAKGHVSAEDALEAARLITKDDGFAFPPRAAEAVPAKPEPGAPSAGPSAEGDSASVEAADDPSQG